MAGVAGGAIELATAYVQLVPSLRGAPEAVAQAFSGAPAQKVGDRIVDGIGTAIRRGGQIPAALSALASKSAAGFSAATDAARLVGQAFAASSRIAGEAAGFINTAWQGTFTRLAPGAAKALAGALPGGFRPYRGCLAGSDRQPGARVQRGVRPDLRGLAACHRPHRQRLPVRCQRRAGSRIQRRQRLLWCRVPRRWRLPEVHRPHQ